MADTVIENIQHDGKDIKLPQSMIDGLTAALANLLLQKVDSINFDSQTSKLTLTFGTGDPLSTDIVLGDLSQLNKNGNANTYLNGSGQWSTPPDTNTVYTHPTTTARTGKPTANTSVYLGNAFTVSQVSNDSSGHVSAITDRTITVNHTTGAGYNHVPSGGSSGQILGWSSAGVAKWQNNTGGVTGVKGNSESTYRTGNVNITAANVGAAASSHTHSATDINSGVLPVSRGGTGVTSLNDKAMIYAYLAYSADEAGKLGVARTIQTNLASGNSASFDGSANVSPGVTGILAVANGGTGNAYGLQKPNFTGNLDELKEPGAYRVVKSGSTNLPSGLSSTSSKDFVVVFSARIMNNVSDEYMQIYFQLSPATYWIRGRVGTLGDWKQLS